MDLKSEIERLRNEMHTEEKAARAQIRAEWQQLFRDVYDQIPEYLREYCTFGVTEELENANFHPTDSGKGGFHKTIPIQIPDFPPIFMDVTWAEINKKWNREHFWFGRLGQIELNGGCWKPIYVQSAVYKSMQLDELLKEALLEREYVNAILDEAERVYPNGKPSPGCKNLQLHHLPSDFPNIQRKIRMK